MNTVVYYVTCDFVYLRAGQITFKLELERSNDERDKREYTIKAWYYHDSIGFETYHNHGRCFDWDNYTHESAC